MISAVSAARIIAVSSYSERLEFLRLLRSEPSGLLRRLSAIVMAFVIYRIDVDTLCRDGTRAYCLSGSTQDSPPWLEPVKAWGLGAPYLIATTTQFSSHTTSNVYACNCERLRSNSTKLKIVSVVIRSRNWFLRKLNVGDVRQGCLARFTCERLGGSVLGVFESCWFVCLFLAVSQ